MPVRLVKLTLNNFRSHRKTVVRFPPSGKLLIRGKNLDTGGSSYSGKSTIGIAIAYVLDAGMPFSGKDQKCWYAEGNMSVELELIADAGTYVVKRGAQWTVKRPDGKTVSGAAAVKEELRNVFGVYPEMLAPLIYKPQAKSGRFLFMPPADKRDFLAKILGIQRMETTAAEAQKTVTAIEAELQVLKYQLNDAESRLRSVSVGEAEIVDLEPLRQHLERMKADADAANQNSGTWDHVEKMAAAEKARNLTDIEKLWAGKIKEANDLVQAVVVIDPPDLVAARDAGEQRLKALQEADRQASTQHYVRRSDAQSGINVINRRLQDAAKLRDEEKDLRAQLKVIEQKVCPTCERPGWGSTEAKQKQLETKIARITDELKDIEALQADLPVFQQRLQDVGDFKPDPKIEALQKTVEHIRRTIMEARESQHQQKAVLMDKVREMEVSKANSLKEANKELDAQIEAARASAKAAADKRLAAQQKLNEAELRLKMVMEENVRRQKDHDAKKAEQAGAETHLKKVQASLQEKQKQLAAEKDFVVMTRSFLTSIFDEILTSIGDRANSILASVANTSHVNIKFHTESVNQKGEAKQQITTAVTIGGFPADDIESGASGGMFSSIDLAVDLAMAEIIGERSNCRPGWVFLDESWEGMDAVTKESCMEVLSRHAEDVLVMVIDHGSETKELFSSFIDVEFQNGISTVVTK